MRLWLTVALVVLVWLLRKLPEHRVQSAAWIRAAQDSATLIEGLATFLTGLGRLVLSLPCASLYTLGNGLSWLRIALQRVPSPRTSLDATEKPDAPNWRVWRKP